MESQPAPPYTLDNGARRYLEANRQLYLDMAPAIEPDRDDWRQVWDRVAFSILSANTRFDIASRSLVYAMSARDAVSEPLAKLLWKEAGKIGITTRKIGYVKELSSPMFSTGVYLRQRRESWNDYRLRLQDCIKGLGIAKATFAACLLYPTTADLACVDVHIHRLFTGIQESPHNIRFKKYVEIESAIRAIGQETGLPTFVTQWAIWDWARGKVENHRIFPTYNSLGTKKE